MKYLGVFLAFTQAAAHAPEGHLPPPPPPLSPREHAAFQKIEEVCQQDVLVHCTPPEETFKNDPILQWMMAPERLAPPMMHPEALDPLDPINIGPLLDHMMDTALRMPMFVQPMEPVFFVLIDDSPFEEQPPEEFVFDSMISRLMQQSDCDRQMPFMPAEEDVTHHIRLKGQHVLDQEDVPEDRRRLARRLTEVSPEDMMKRPQFPYHEHPRISPGKHKCLLQAREQNKLLPECHGAVSRLERIHEFEQNQRDKMDLYMTFFWLYCILFSAFFVLAMARKFKNTKGLFFLRLRILQAVYSNPDIKAKVEDEVGLPLGDVPPVPSGALKLLSQEGRNECKRKRQRFCFILYTILGFFVLDANGFLPDSWPLFVMGGCCAFMACRIVSLCFQKQEHRECKCCCCGGSTTDVADGTVSDAQACCKCCKGSGVCSPKCKSCCGNGSNKNQCGKKCCDEKCDCCKCCEAEGLYAAEYKLLVEGDCKCCCCGGSTSDVTNGTVSEAQACCNCCKGTGECSAKCKSCCGGGAGTCCDGTCNCAKDHCCDGSCDCCSDKNEVNVGPNTVVYQGVPIQIV